MSDATKQVQESNFVQNVVNTVLNIGIAIAAIVVLGFRQSDPLGLQALYPELGGFAAFFVLAVVIAVALGAVFTACYWLYRAARHSRA